MRNLARLAFTSSIVLVGTLLMTATKAPSVGAQAQKQAPYFEVDPFWPKPLPNHWVTGSTIGLSVDDQDNVWTIHRPNTVDANFKAADIKASEAKDDEVQPGAEGAAPPSTDMIGACCKVAPPVLVYDRAGNLVRSWGGPGPGYDWPDSNHGITVDGKGNVWLAGNGRNDTQVLKFTREGKFLLQVGKHGVHNGSNDTQNFWQPTKIFHEPSANEVYIADGYGNRRIIVLDADSGEYRRHWGAYGARPDDAKMPPYNPKSPPSKQFSTMHCAIVSHDGLVYACDRVNDRIQVFKKDGTFVKEAFIDPKTYRSGSVWDMAFSRDPDQTYIYQANGVDEKVNILLRSTLEVLTSFGDGGRQPGQFFGVHNLATDSKGNLYTAETYAGARVQRFIFKGVRPVTKREQGVPWPQGGALRSRLWREIMGMPNRREFVAMSVGAAAASRASAFNAPSAAGAPSGDLVALSLGEASRRIRARQVTSVELTQALLDRIKVYNPKLNAYITVMRAEAMAQAARMDEEAKAGKFLSPLHGVPIALKDNIDTAGTRTTAASQVFDDRVPEEDAEVARRLKDAGAVIIGKTNLHEFANGGSSASTYFGPVRNPWALDRIPSGSSGGSAAAVSADLAFAALGTDTGGSIRQPAAFCSIVGLKPTYGLVSIRGIIPLIYSLDHCGPMTKTVEDAALLLNHMTGYDSHDVASVEHAGEDYVAAVRQPVSGIRLGVPRAPYFDRLDEEIGASVEAAIGVLSGLTKTTVDCRLPGTAGFDSLSLGAERVAYHLELFRRNSGRYSLHIRQSLEATIKSMNDGASEPCAEKVVDYVNSQWKLSLLRRNIDAAFTNFDLVVLPTMRIMPRTIDDALNRERVSVPREPESVSNCAPFNVFGLPTISVPCGFSKSGLPIGLMIAGPRFSEGKVLALAQAYEKATEWHTRRPVLTPDMVVPALKPEATATRGSLE